jgi:hypothetical protein
MIERAAGHHVEIMFNERLVPMPLFAALGATDGTPETGPLAGDFMVIHPSANICQAAFLTVAMLRTRSRTSTAFCCPRYASNAVSSAWIMASLISGFGSSKTRLHVPLDLAGTIRSGAPVYHAALFDHLVGAEQNR